MSGYLNDNCTVLRQIEQYNSGVRLCYGGKHIEDEFGGLSQTPLDLLSQDTLQSRHKISRQLGASCRLAATGHFRTFNCMTKEVLTEWTNACTTVRNIS